MRRSRPYKKRRAHPLAGLDLEQVVDIVSRLRDCIPPECPSLIEKLTIECILQYLCEETSLDLAITRFVYQHPWSPVPKTAEDIPDYLRELDELRSQDGDIIS